MTTARRAGWPWLEAWAWLMVASALVALVGFRRWARWLGQPHQDTPLVALSAAQWQQAYAVRRALGQARRLLPWHITCLMEAAAAKWMLNRRGLPNTLYLGALHQPDDAARPLHAHAWVRCGTHVIVGGTPTLTQFAVVGRFASGAAHTP